MSRRLIHYTAAPMILDERVYRQPLGEKPSGLWVTHEGPICWREWCEAESFNTERLAWENEIVVQPHGRFLEIGNAKELDAFTALYGRRPIDWPNGTIGVFKVDWPSIALDWDGIMIFPYLRERRFGLGALWYHGWDCASGCIWNTRAILHVESRPAPAQKEAP